MADLSVEEVLVLRAISRRKDQLLVYNDVRHVFETWPIFRHFINSISHYVLVSDNKEFLLTDVGNAALKAELNYVGEGDFIGTWSGATYWPLSPRPKDVAIFDIAHSLSKICRFNGHCRDFYSVAEHSVHVADIVYKWTANKRAALYAILHDASEAFCHDLVRPIKRSIIGYKDIEIKNMAAIHKRFDLGEPEESIVRDIRKADNAMLTLEHDEIINRPVRPWQLDEDADPGIGIMCLPPDKAADLFLRKWTEYST